MKANDNIKKMIVDTFGEDVFNVLISNNNSKEYVKTISYDMCIAIQQDASKIFYGEHYNISGVGSVVDILYTKKYPHYALAFIGIEREVSNMLIKCDGLISSSEASLDIIIETNKIKTIESIKKYHSEKFVEFFRNQSNKDPIVVAKEFFKKSLNNTIEQYKQKRNIDELNIFLTNIIENPSSFID